MKQFSKPLLALLALLPLSLSTRSTSVCEKLKAKEEAVKIISHAEAFRVNTWVLTGRFDF